MRAVNGRSSLSRPTAVSRSGSGKRLLTGQIDELMGVREASLLDAFNRIGVQIVLQVDQLGMTFAPTALQAVVATSRRLLS